MKARNFLYLGLIIVGSSIVPLWGFIGLILEGLGLFLLLLQGQKLLLNFLQNILQAFHFTQNQEQNLHTFTSLSAAGRR